MSKQNKIGALIIIFFLVLAMFYCDYAKDKKKKIISDETVFGIGIVNDIYYDRFGQKLHYSFNVDSAVYSATISTNLGNSKSDWNEIKNHKWPVIYSKSVPSNNEILIQKVDFEKWNLMMPDSLMWVCDSLHLCY